MSAASLISSAAVRSSPSRAAAKAAWATRVPQRDSSAGVPYSITGGAMRCAAASITDFPTRARPDSRNTCPSCTAAAATDTRSPVAAIIARSTANHATSGAPSFTSSDAVTRYASTSGTRPAPGSWAWVRCASAANSGTRSTTCG
ncbi:hypothetical protein ACIBJE_10390 [Micromonospora sp. NPDC050187]|uniref:hypothetical protein n=1 Tax=Micromonospora sp. NPDC050187 TaxID=3364277 RepID=UPI0037A327DF